jgi:hypothetical protein
VEGLRGIWLSLQNTRNIKKVTSSQDDGLVEELRGIWLNLQNTRNIKKVTSSQDDGLVGG